MPHLPFLKFFPADWLQDIQVLTLQAQGAWIKIICALHVSSDYGKRTFSRSELMTFLGIQDDDYFASVMSEIDRVADIWVRDQDDNMAENYDDAREITITCRRMVREQHQRNQGSERVKRFRNADVTEKKRVRSQKSEAKKSYSKKSDKPPISPKGGQDDDFAFNKFWQSYPRKEGKNAAYKAWCKEAKHCLDVQSAIFEALAWQVGQAQWQRDGGQYIPHPTTYLNQGRWKDKPVEVSNVRQPEPKGFEALRQFQAIRDRQVR